MFILWRFLCLLAGAICAPLVANAQQQTLVIATNIYPPYVLEDVKNSFLPVLFDEIGKKMKVRFEYVIQPWKRCEQSVESLEVWGAIPYARTAEREKKFLFSAPIYISDSKFFAYRDPQKNSDQSPPATYDDLRELRKWRIGGIQGYYYEPIFKEAYIDTDYALSEQQNFMRLQLGRIDLFPAAVTVGWSIINDLFPREIAANFYTLEKPLSHDGTVHLMTSKRYPDNDALLQRFNQALLTVRANGTFAQLAEEFGLTMRY